MHVPFMVQAIDLRALRASPRSRICVDVRREN